MRFFPAVWICICAAAAAQSTQGIRDLVQRRLPLHADSFSFSLVNTTAANSSTPPNDVYRVSTPGNGTVRVEGNSLSALASGLHRYLADVAGVDIYWYIGSRLHLAPSTLPRVEEPLTGSSVVPWRYHFNTVTFSYTAAFWNWDDWEEQLDWMALRGINLPLAWVGQERIVVDMYRELGLTDAEINSFLSGPAFQAWNRFGNIQGSWGGDLPESWIDAQFALQQKIVQRMVALGMTPVLPSFAGFVPRAITRVLPNATVVNGSTWGGFPTEYTNVTFLEPFDDTFAMLQKSFIARQQAAYGNVSSIYTLDQYNENTPYSGDLDYLKNITKNTLASLKAADPNAVWMMQGWLFFSSSAFWTNDRVEAYLSGIENDEDVLILDLFSESQPQWQRTNSYFGKPWIWCQLHDYGGTMGLYGQIENLTINPIEALANSSSLVGFGNTMEGQEGNDIIYDLLLDQAWSSKSIETKKYFHDWVTTRYAGSASIPEELYQAWEVMRPTVFNNTHLAFNTNTSSESVPRSILAHVPAINGLLGPTGSPTVNFNVYPDAVMEHAWSYIYNASEAEPSLWDNPAYQYDMVDITRQVLANAFVPLYVDLITTYNASNASSAVLQSKGEKMLDVLSALDSVLLTNENFLLSKWISQARAWANATSTNSTLADFYEYEARNQITLWGPDGEISDYAQKQWGGLVASYYRPRWQMFIDYLSSTRVESYNGTALLAQLMPFEQDWQTQKWGVEQSEVYGVVGELPQVIDQVKTALPGLFEGKI